MFDEYSQPKHDGLLDVGDKNEFGFEHVENYLDDLEGVKIFREEFEVVGCEYCMSTDSIKVDALNKKTRMRMYNSTTRRILRMHIKIGK